MKHWELEACNEDTRVGSEEAENLELLSHSEPSLLASTSPTYFT